MLSTSLCRSSAPNAGAGTSRISQRSGATWATWDFLMFRTPLNAKVSTDGLTNAPLLPKMLSSTFPVTGSIIGKGRPQRHPPDIQRVRSESLYLTDKFTRVRIERFGSGKYHRNGETAIPLRHELGEGKCRRRIRLQHHRREPLQFIDDRVRASVPEMPG